MNDLIATAADQRAAIGRKRHTGRRTPELIALLAGGYFPEGDTTIYVRGGHAASVGCEGQSDDAALLPLELANGPARRQVPVRDHATLLRTPAAHAVDRQRGGADAHQAQAIGGECQACALGVI